MPRTAPAAFSRPLTPSPSLAAVIGAEPRSRPQITKDLWIYIKAHALQDPADRRTIVADGALRPVIGERCSMLELAGLLGKHLEG